MQDIGSVVAPKLVDGRVFKRAFRPFRDEFYLGLSLLNDVCYGAVLLAYSLVIANLVSFIVFWICFLFLFFDLFIF